MLDKIKLWIAGVWENNYVKAIVVLAGVIGILMFSLFVMSQARCA